MNASKRECFAKIAFDPSFEYLNQNWLAIRDNKQNKRMIMEKK